MSYIFWWTKISKCHTVTYLQLTKKIAGNCRTCRTCEGWGSRNRMLGPNDISGSGDSTDLGLLKTNTPSSPWRWGPALMRRVNSTRITAHATDTPPRICFRFAIRNSQARSVDDITPLYSWPGMPPLRYGVITSIQFQTRGLFPAHVGAGLK